MVRRGIDGEIGVSKGDDVVDDSKDDELAGDQRIVQRRLRHAQSA